MKVAHCRMCKFAHCGITIVKTSLLGFSMQQHSELGLSDESLSIAASWSVLPHEGSLFTVATKLRLGMRLYGCLS